jgi:hypothetical protein
VQALRVDAIADSGQTYGGRAFRDRITAAQRQHIPVILARRRMRYVTDDGVTFDALAPDEPLCVDGSNHVNENSGVLRLTYRRPGCA